MLHPCLDLLLVHEFIIPGQAMGFFSMNLMMFVGDFENGAE
jgi:hypothetical protein